MLTKGTMIKELKKVGIRKGEKQGYTVKLEHLKTPDVAKLHSKYCK